MTWGGAVAGPACWGVCWSDGVGRWTVGKREIVRSSVCGLVVVGLRMVRKVVGFFMGRCEEEGTATDEKVTILDAGALRGGHGPAAVGGGLGALQKESGGLSKRLI